MSARQRTHPVPVMASNSVDLVVVFAFSGRGGTTHLDDRPVKSAAALKCLEASGSTLALLTFCFLKLNNLSGLICGLLLPGLPSSFLVAV